MKEKLKKLAQRAALVGGSMVAAGAAMAADDPGIEALNKLSETASTYIAAAFAVAALIAAGMWSLRMMKKAFSKAG